MKYLNIFDKVDDEAIALTKDVNESKNGNIATELCRVFKT